MHQLRGFLILWALRIFDQLLLARLHLVGEQRRGLVNHRVIRCVVAHSLVVLRGAEVLLVGVAGMTWVAIAAVFLVELLVITEVIELLMATVEGILSFMVRAVVGDVDGPDVLLHVLLLRLEFILLIGIVVDV